ncbi:MAG: hypothetical protein ACLGJC_22300 [Alphaproteobacteria bacterium]
MGPTVADLVAAIIDRIEDRRVGLGCQPMSTVEVIETLRFFLREGIQWHELWAADGRASGSTLRRRPEEWHRTALHRRVHAVLVRMARSGPDAAAWDVVVDVSRGRLHGRPAAGGHAVCAAIGRLYADAGYDSAENRWLCLRDGVQPHIRKIGEPHGSGLGKIRCVVEHGCAWLLANKRLDRRQDRFGRIVLSSLTAAAILIIANRLSAF